MINYNRDSNKEKWTFMKYMKNFFQIVQYADAIRKKQSSLEKEKLRDIQRDFEQMGSYTPRFGKSSIDTILCKTKQIVYYMFGYSKNIEGETKIVFSPLGNLLLDNQNDMKIVSKTFITMLFSIEFKHPFNKMSSKFKLYPFRLIFQLLLDEKLNGRLYNDEVFYYVMFIKKISDTGYNELVNDILEFRKKSCEEKFNIFLRNENVIADALHLWRYTVGTLEGAEILVEYKTDNILYGNLKQGKNTKRSYKYEYVKLNKNLEKYAESMLASYPYNADVLTSNGNMLQSDIVTEMYNFYPKELIEELGLEEEYSQKKIMRMLSLTKEIEQTSKNLNLNDCYKFEDVLTETFNYFIDVRAEKISGAGNTDIECLFEGKNQRKKFDVEAKSTKNKLSALHSKRLSLHREKIGSLYTIVITPEYTPGVLEDIRNEHIVIIKSRTLSNLMYQMYIKYDRNISYEAIDEIISGNLGEDITSKIDLFILEELGSRINDIY